MNWVADGIARIKNATMVGKSQTVVRGTKFFLKVLDVIKEEGLIKGYELVQSDSDSSKEEASNELQLVKSAKQSKQSKLKQQCVVHLLYRDTKSVIRGIKVISNPSLRVYIKKDGIRKYLNRFAIPVISTSQGVLSGKEAAARNIGGELICEVL